LRTAAVRAHTLRLVFVVLLTVTVVLSVAATAGATVRLSGVEQDMLTAVNQARAAQGLAPVRAQRRLVCAARAHSRSMAHLDYFSHDSADGRTFSARLQQHGYVRSGYRGWTVGEDIASGRTGTVCATAEAVVQLWMESATHRSVMLTAAFKDAGVGVHDEGDTRYFTLDLGRRSR
jgi:uncharacterized protein YkwD